MSLVVSRRDASVRRGAVVKALAVATPYQYLDVFKTPLVLALDHYLALSLKRSAGASGGDLGLDAAEVAVLAGFFAALNGVDLSNLPRPSGPARALMWRGVSGAAALAASPSPATSCGASPHGNGGGNGSAHSPAAWTWDASCTLALGTEATRTVLPLAFPIYASLDEVVSADTPVLSTLAAALGGDQLLKVATSAR